MLLSEITKKEVLDINANRVGYIIDADLNVQQGTISHFVLREGIFKKYPLMPDKISRIGEKVFLNINKDSIEGKLPSAVVK